MENTGASMGGTTGYLSRESEDEREKGSEFGTGMRSKIVKAMFLAWFLFYIEGGKEYVLKVPFNRAECNFYKDFHQRYIPTNWYECINLGMEQTREGQLYQSFRGLIVDGAKEVYKPGGGN